MKKKTVLRIIPTLLLIAILSFNINTIKAERTIIVPEDYLTIQEAIDAASPRDTIVVREGLYAEGQINVYKPLILKAEGRVVVDGLNTALGVFFVTSHSVVIEGFTVKNGSHSGIELSFVDNCRIEGNIVRDNYVGVSVTGHNNVIKGNEASNNRYGIFVTGTPVFSSTFNVVKKNIVANNDRFGIALRWADKNIIEGNIVRNNSVGITIAYSNNNKAVGNRVTNSDWCIALGFSDYNTIEENNLADNLEDGILLVCSDYNILKKNEVARNTHYGIVVRFSPGNAIKENVVKQSEFGIAIIGFSSDYNIIKENHVLRSNEFDLYWDGSGTGNIWIENKYKTKTDNIMQQEEDWKR